MLTAATYPFDEASFEFSSVISEWPRLDYSESYSRWLNKGIMPDCLFKTMLAFKVDMRLRSETYCLPLILPGG